MRIQLSALVRNYTDVPYVFDITLKINSPPSGGVVTVTPSSGQAMTTDFTIAVTGATDINQPL